MKIAFEQFCQLLAERERPVVLLEGTRDLPDADSPILILFGQFVAETFPLAIFRTGNAKGSDEAFAKGVQAVDPARLQYVLPYAGHRKRGGESASYRIALTELPRVAEDRAAYQTAQSSPQYRSMMDKRDSVPSLKSKAGYLIRDTLKVTGAEEAKLAPATVGIFYVNQYDPMKGGTGHTIRVCLGQGVPVAYQTEWMTWPGKAKAGMPAPTSIQKER